MNAERTPAANWRLNTRTVCAEAQGIVHATFVKAEQVGRMKLYWRFTHCGYTVVSDETNRVDLEAKTDEPVSCFACLVEGTVW